MHDETVEESVGAAGEVGRGEGVADCEWGRRRQREIRRRESSESSPRDKRRLEMAVRSSGVPSPFKREKSVKEGGKRLLSLRPSVEELTIS